MVYRLTSAAEDHIEALLLDSARNYGLEAAGRYGQLILVVMAALGDEPDLLGSIEVPGLAGIRAYPIRMSRRRVQPARRVVAPRHLIVYRLSSNDIIEILGLVPDRMVLSRAALKLVRSTDES